MQVWNDGNAYDAAPVFRDERPPFSLVQSVRATDLRRSPRA